MSKLLYMLCESERDEMFYEHLAEHVTGQSFQTDMEYRVRHGSNWKTAMSAARMLVRRFRSWTEKQDIALIIAVDNDRAPGHPGGVTYDRPLPKTDQRKPARYNELKHSIETELGPNPSAWPIDLALAVPVEMIESWLLILCAPARPELPPFSDSFGLAKRYYNGHPPPQLKDLTREEAHARGMSLDELFWHAAEQDVTAAAKRSLSLQLFIDQLQTWRRL